MRLCRYRHNDAVNVAFYDDERVLPMQAAGKLYSNATHRDANLPDSDNLLTYLPGGDSAQATADVWQWVQRQDTAIPDDAFLATGDVPLLVPIPRPNKLFLLAGNYAKHIEEGGGIAAERAETFPYVFMKPASTALTDPGKPIRIPHISPDTIDWELELAVVIGTRCKAVSESDALQAAAGFTVINDVSNRKFRPNPGRKLRDKDSFFDWLHGKWHDSFCPCGPCIAAPSAVPDPQQLDLQLKVNGKIKQDSSTSQQIFPVAAVIEFISSFVTLEPGDIISTGTPAGVGNTTGDYLKPGDRIEASISSIGTLSSPVEAE